MTGNAELKIHVPKNFSVGEVIHGSCVTSVNDFYHMSKSEVTISISSNGCTVNLSNGLKTERNHYKKDFTITCNTNGSHHIECHTNGMDHINKRINFQGT